MNRIVGIDPGKSGAIAVYQYSPVFDPAQPITAISKIEILKLSDVTEFGLYEFLKDRSPAIAYMEQVSSSPQQGVVSAFTFGQGYGQLRMAVLAAGIRLETVRPVKWQSALRLRQIGGGFGKNDKAKKHRNKQRAEELFPGVRVTLTNCDALLLLEFGRLSEQVPTPTNPQVIYL